MRILVVTLAPTLFRDGCFHSYAPYVKEMNVWFKHVENVTILSPTRYPKKLLTAPFFRKDIEVKNISGIGFDSMWNALKSFFYIPFILFEMFKQMQRADHIHLRCPGNIALLGCIAQVFFPKKRKTAKYAGNWDPNAKQPLSYRFQKWILSNTFLTKNMQILVYGNWPNITKNVKPFYTATYPKNKIEETSVRKFNEKNKFLFVGNLAPGKRPIYAVKIIEALKQEGISCTLDLYGDGAERNALESYVKKNNLFDGIKLWGNQSAETVELAYRQSQFLLLPSKSEGWPKVVAEAMFWGVIPVVTNISCVPWMLGNGKRGILLDKNLKKDVETLLNEIQDKESLQKKSIKAQQWSQRYTLDDFEGEIKKLL